MTERDKMCIRKRRYDSKAVARAAAVKGKERYGQDLRVYRCPYCLLWHVTTEPYDYERFKGRPRRAYGVH